MTTELTNAPKQELAQTPENNLKRLLSSDNMKRQFAAALPAHLKVDRFCRVAITALTRTPQLAQCTQESFFKCLLDLSAWGIEPDGRRAHLIPFKRKMKVDNQWTEVMECTLILDWKGLAELAMRSGMIAKLHSDLICDNDEFAYDMGEVLHHRINWKAPRGEPYAAYAIAETKDGAKFCQVMTKDEIEKIRNGSQGYKSAIQYNKTNPWIESPGEMWKKTVFRRLSKWLPLSPEFRDAADKEDEDMGLAGMERDVTPGGISTPTKPKFLSKPEPETPPEEPSQPVEEQPDPNGVPTVSTTASKTKEELLRDLKSLQDEHAVSDTQVKAWAVRENVVTSQATMLKNYEVSALEYIIANWNDCVEGSHWV